MTRAALLAATVALVAASGCRVGPRLFVTVEQIPANTATIDATFTRNQQPARAAEHLRPPGGAATFGATTTTFVVELPAGRAEVTVALSAIDGAGCARATGSATVTADDNELPGVRITLAPSATACAPGDGGAVVPEADCLDGLDDNGDGLPDCADPTCADRATCIPDAPGAELGVVPSRACPAEYGDEVTWVRGLVSPTTCSGCTCTPQMSCAYQLSFRSTTDCTGATIDSATVTVSGTVGLSNATTSCSQLAAPISNAKSVYTSAIAQTTSCSTSASGATPNRATWTARQSFCPARRTSLSCRAGQICVGVTPSTETRCVRVVGEAAACPPGYSGPMTWYEPTQIDDPRTCTCGCTTNGAGSCDSGITPFILSTSSCTGQSGYFIYSPPSHCAAQSGVNLFSPGFQFVRYSGEAWGSSGVSCSATGTAVGTARPKNGSTFCCR